jgi:hypothetical protein
MADDMSIPMVCQGHLWDNLLYLYLDVDSLCRICCYFCNVDTQPLYNMEFD